MPTFFYMFHQHHQPLLTQWFFVIIKPMKKPIAIYSHGFGVKKDDRGLFTDIAVQLSEFEHVMFNYNSFDEANNTMTVTPLDEQAEKLAKKIKVVKESNPDTPLYLICHSQGCIVAALAKAEGFEKINTRQFGETVVDFFGMD
jgi:predicted alpha/beta hydrolase